MGRDDTKLSFKGEDIYVGLDISKKSWTVTILTEHHEHKTFNQPPVPEVLVRYIHKHFPEANYVCAYEAELFGFWIYEALKEHGVNCIVVHPADMPNRDFTSSQCQSEGSCDKEQLDSSAERSCIAYGIHRTEQADAQEPGNSQDSSEAS